MSKKRFDECPYLWKISDEKENFELFAFANSASEALSLVEKEIELSEPIIIEIVCFANDIVNFK